MDPLLMAVVFVIAVSFLSNVSPFLGASYTLLATSQLTALGFSLATFVVLVIVSAVGATAAKIVIYYGGLGFRDYLLKNKNVRLIGKYSSTQPFYLALFVTALLPVFPFDDFIYIGAGATASTLGLMAAVTLLAKLIKSGVEIALEFTFLKGLSHLLGLGQLELTVVFTAAFIVIGIVVYKVDWEVLYARVTGSAKPVESLSG